MHFTDETNIYGTNRRHKAVSEATAVKQALITIAVGEVCLTLIQAPSSR